jgi:hypothetical protein
MSERLTALCVCCFVFVLSSTNLVIPDASLAYQLYEWFRDLPFELEHIWPLVSMALTLVLSYYLSDASPSQGTFLVHGKMEVSLVQIRRHSTIPVGTSSRPRN